MNLSISPLAAIDAIKRRTARRVYAETSALKLLGMEDKAQARLEWKQWVGRPILDTESRLLDNVRNEIARRPKSEMEEAQVEWIRRNKIWSYFPDEGPFRRELYPEHMNFVAATKTDDEVMMLAANRTGKSQLGALCVAHWAMGRYPKWWDGRLFDLPTTGWVCNKTAKDCRDINEAELLGPPGSEAERGTGMIPSHLIQKCTPKPGTPNAYEFISVEHVSGATSYIVTKSYDQGRTAFQGRKIDYGWGDEEIDRECYDEMYMRSSVRGDITTGVQPPGVLILTYTPIQGLTEMTTWFMESAGLSLEAMRQGKLDMEEVLG